MNRRGFLRMLALMPATPAAAKLARLIELPPAPKIVVPGWRSPWLANMNTGFLSQYERMMQEAIRRIAQEDPWSSLLRQRPYQVQEIEDVTFIQGDELEQLLASSQRIGRLWCPALAVGIA